eukprot:1177485-Prorocentrum_minimum.AAC.1
MLVSSHRRSLRCEKHIRVSAANIISSKARVATVFVGFDRTVTRDVYLGDAQDLGAPLLDEQRDGVGPGAERLDDVVVNEGPAHAKPRLNNPKKENQTLQWGEVNGFFSGKIADNLGPARRGSILGSECASGFVFTTGGHTR